VQASECVKKNFPRKNKTASSDNCRPKEISKRVYFKKESEEVRKQTRLFLAIAAHGI
jgi:hypothetical protein